ncbi:LLM class flavin-dependent oxidoreductase [Peterkaempfera bronchialis]|uniref:LLM class flavin-dependent oxidoreductase n=1 Tax=Peterkaempfera bronchialis TaxID=2126346 RepID=A0A345STB2_9ACTN|nr:LLM class flavin-dependent oxidoreductase [Peterkaempfera bronchialis]AXI76967.1 LLM class flavin-dependent oxidoreductase [Peterkaempfera bronchialis]
MSIHWFLPTASDGRSLAVGTQRSHGPGIDQPASQSPCADRFRPPDLRYLTQIAQAAEQLGFDAVLTPTNTWCEDAWLTCAALARETERLRFMVALRPGYLVPTLAAQMAATFQRHSGGRLLLNIVTGGEDTEQARFGDHLIKSQRYQRCDEFLTVLRGAWSGTPFTFTGQHYDVRDATVLAPPDPIPEVLFGGSSTEAGPVAAAHADTYLTWGEPPDQVAAKLDRIRKLAAAAGRTVRFGIRFHVVTRDTSQEAWAAAERLIAGIDPDHIDRVQRVLAASQSTGQAAMNQLHTAYRTTRRTADLEIYPNVWAGVGLLRGGAGTALVGSHREVADRITEYQALGIEEFVLSGFPHLEEAYWVGEGVLPLLTPRPTAAVTR